MRACPIKTFRNSLLTKITNYRCKPSTKQLGATTIATLASLNAMMNKNTNVVLEDNQDHTYCYTGKIPSIYLTKNPNIKYSYSKDKSSLSTEDFDISFSFSNKKAKVKNFELKNNIAQPTIIDIITQYINTFKDNYNNLFIVKHTKPKNAHPFDIREAWSKACEMAGEKV